MYNPIEWIINKHKAWRFKRAFDRAPIMCLGEIFVKEVQGNLYAVDLEITHTKKCQDQDGLDYCICPEVTR